jgi:hypothetical protein
MLSKRLPELINKAIVAIELEAKERELDPFQVYNEKLGTITKILEERKNVRKAICN